MACIRVDRRQADGKMKGGKESGQKQSLEERKGRRAKWNVSIGKEKKCYFLNLEGNVDRVNGTKHIQNSPRGQKKFVILFFKCRRKCRQSKRNETHTEFTEERYTQETKRQWQKTVNMNERPAERKKDGWH
jgi:hypothetical protein